MDRLSGLPEDVIGHILSFLPTTKCFVRTSILAKHWRFLWTRVPYLGFTTLNGVTNHSRNKIDNELKSWIRTIFTRDLRNIVIRINYKLVKLPQCLFTSNTLVELCIVDSGDVPKFGTVSFPALKKLQLVHTRYDSDLSLVRLVSGCPVLEELVMDRMLLNYPYQPFHKIYRVIEKIKEMKFNTPALISYLRLHAYELPYILTRRLDSLIEADIDLSEAQFEWSLLTDFLSKICNVKRLTLSTPIESDKRSYLVWNSYLCNLTELNLRGNWSFIKRFLVYAKNLRVLTICLHVVDHDTQWWKEPEQVHACLLSHLETVNLVDFRWSTNQAFEMVKYFLRNAKVLKMMEIICTAQHYEEFDWNGKVEVLNRLALFEMQASCIRLSLL